MKGLFYVKKISKLLLLILSAIIIYGCGSSKDDNNPDLIKPPASASSLHKENYKDVVTKFEKSGFEIIEVQKLEDLITGWITKDGSVESVSIDGDTNYDSNKKYSKNSKILIIYHTFKNRENNTNNSTESAQSETSVSSSEITEETTTISETTVVLDDVITIQNNPEFAEIMSIKGDNDPKFDEFAKKYMYKTIEFDGNIVFFQKHPNRKTRFDVMFMGGDYIDADTFNPGPTFRVQDVGMYELARDSSAPEYIKVGLNGHYKFTIVDYRSDSAIFEVRIEEIKYR